MPWTQVHAGPWREITDDLGHTVRLQAPARRIIALYGAYNEILAAMGLEARIVARTKRDVLPPSIVSKPSIGTHMRPNVEMVVMLKPDLIIQEAGRRDALLAVEQLRREGLPVAVFHPISFSDLFSVIKRLGILTGAEPRAAALIRSMQSRLRRVQEKTRRLRVHPPRVFFEVRYPNLLGVGQRSIVNDIIRHAGGRNCVPINKKLCRINMEQLIAWNPEVYIVQKGPMNPNPGSPAERPHFAVLDAVRKGRILFVEEERFSRPGPRTLDAVEELARYLAARFGERPSP